MGRARFGVPNMSGIRLANLARTDADTHTEARRGEDPRVVVGRKGLEERLDHLIAAQDLVVGHTTEVLSLIGAGVENQVLETATRTMGANGWLHRQYQVPFAGVAVVNPSSSAITVQEGAAGGTAAQGDGPGSFVVPAGSFLCLPLVGRAVVFYAAAGARFSFSVFTRRPEPSAGGTLGGGTATGAVRAQENSTLLLAGATINGATLSAAGYSKLRAFAASDQAGTLNIQQARLAAGPWYQTTTAAVAAGNTAGTILESLLALPFARAQYVNGATNQGTFEFDSALIAV